MTKSTPQISLSVRFSFCGVSLTAIAELQLFTENALALHSINQRCIQN